MTNYRLAGFPDLRAAYRAYTKIAGVRHSVSVLSEVDTFLSWLDREVDAGSIKIVQPFLGPRIYYQASCPLCSKMEASYHSQMRELAILLTKFKKRHPHCTDCGILMGDGHYETVIQKRCDLCEDRQTGVTR